MSKLTAFCIMAMRDATFFTAVGCRLMELEKDRAVRFISFYQPANQLIERAGFRCYDMYSYRRSGKVIEESPSRYEECYGIRNLHRLILHEKVTSECFQDPVIENKFMEWLDAADSVVRDMCVEYGPSQTTVIQELGGFVGPLSVFFSCRRHGVEHVFLEPSFFRGRLHAVRNSLAAIDCGGTEPAASNDDEALNVEAYLENLKQARRPVIPDKDVHHFKDMGLAKIFNPRNISRFLGKLIDKYVRGHRHEFDFVWRYSKRHMAMYFNRKLNGFLYTGFDAAAREAKYVYFPFHVQLDYALTVRCPEYLNQLALVDQICQVLPARISLYVKEHPASIGGFRNSELRHLLAKHANLRLVHPSVNSYELVEHARLVVTINSKAGAEALVLGKRVIVLGDAFYTHSGLADYVANPRELEQAMRRQLSETPAVPAAGQVLKFFERVWRHTYAGELYNVDDVNVSAFAESVRRFSVTSQGAAETNVSMGHS